jgi:hypothetical protein
MVPPSIPHDPYEHAKIAANSLLTTVELARGLIDNLRPVDLAGLEDEVGRLCARALDLPPERGRALQPLLCRVAAAMDALTGSLESANG